MADYTDATVLAWQDDPGWKVTRASTARVIAFDPALWAQLPTTLQAGAIESYRQFAQSPEYLPWWADACGGDAPGVRRFALSTPAAHWERPWESTIAALDRGRWRDVAMVRLVAGQQASAAPREVGSPLQVLVVQGSPSGAGLDELDLAAELDALTQARDSLDAAVKALVPPIQMHTPGRGELVDLLTQTRPALLWLSGHATDDPPGFLLADGQWLSPSELADAVQAAAKDTAAVPLYVVLWACRTGLREHFAAPAAAPPFIGALARVGVSAVLATLGPLADDIAADFAAAILRGVALGRPLDHAVAHGRAELMAIQGATGERDDWACPVVWCVDLPGGELTWSPATAPAQRQDLARRLLPPDLAPVQADAASRRQADLWSSQQRVWVSDRTAGAFEVRSAWLSRVLAQQRTSSRMVIVLDFRRRSAGAVLRDWADRVLRITDGFDDPGRQLRTLAVRIQQDPASGWPALCREQITVALIEPPEQDAWLWDGLRAAPATAVVLAESFPLTAAQDGWNAEELIIDTVDTELTLLDRPFAAGLAILGFPAAEPDVTGMDADRVQRLEDTGLLVRTRAGCVMPLSRAASLAQSLDADELAQAHRTAFAMLDGDIARAQIVQGTSEALLAARFDHATRSGDAQYRSMAAQQLLGYYRDQRRASAFLGVAGQVSFRTIEEGWKVSAGWAQLAAGSLEEARDLLEDVHTDELDPVEQADRFALLAEVQKSSGEAGSKDRARKLLERALSVLNGQPEEDVAVTRVRVEHDLARLTHFLDGDPASAIPQYRTISAIWQTRPGHGLDEAITLRNLAEAELALADRGGDSTLYDRAADDLARARDRLPPNTGHPVAAELEYVAGRLAVRCGDEERATRCFTQAQAVGLATNHMMLVAIAEARLFWRGIAHHPTEEYDPGGWIERAEVLQPFDKHAWAARVLIDGHLSSARRLIDAGLLRAAVAPLRSAWLLLQANPAFDAGSDRIRIASAAAGLALAAADPTLWQSLPGRYAWFAQWALVNDANTPATAWKVRR